MKKFIFDLLKEEGKWSQGRIYLLLSIVAYYTTLTVVTLWGMNGKSQLDIDSFKIIIDALQFALLLFGGYVFGGKFLNIIPLLKGNKENKKTEE